MNNTDGDDNLFNLYPTLSTDAGSGWITKAKFVVIKIRWGQIKVV